MVCGLSSRDVRTSQGTFISRGSDPQGVLAWVEEKAAQVTGLPVNYGEVRTLATPLSALFSPVFSGASLA
jgi:hypothetical protein